jgi:hypothetical protein
MGWPKPSARAMVTDLIPHECTRPKIYRTFAIAATHKSIFKILFKGSMKTIFHRLGWLNIYFSSHFYDRCVRAGWLEQYIYRRLWYRKFWSVGIATLRVNLLVNLDNLTTVFVVLVVFQVCCRDGQRWAHRPRVCWCLRATFRYPPSWKRKPKLVIGQSVATSWTTSLQQHLRRQKYHRGSGRGPCALTFYNLAFKKITFSPLRDVNSSLDPRGRRQDSWLRDNTSRHHRSSLVERQCLVHPKFQKFYKIPRHIKSLDACMKH